MSYFSKNRHKYYLKCHLIFVCKYRKQLITDEVRKHILNVFKNIEKQSDFDIEIMETDKDHIHMLISYPPNISVSSIVRRLKQCSTLSLWKHFLLCLPSNFGKNIHFGVMDILFAQLVKQIQIQ